MDKKNMILYVAGAILLYMMFKKKDAGAEEKATPGTPQTLPTGRLTAQQVAQLAKSGGSSTTRVPPSTTPASSSTTPAAPSKIPQPQGKIRPAPVGACTGPYSENAYERCMEYNSPFWDTQRKAAGTKNWQTPADLAAKFKTWAAQNPEKVAYQK